MRTVWRAWRAICEWFNAPVAEIEGCRTCKWAVTPWCADDSRLYCDNEKGHARLMGDGFVYLGNPYTAEQCGEAYERRDGE